MDPSAAVCEHPQVVLALLAVLILVVVFLLYKMYYKKSSSSGLANVLPRSPNMYSAANKFSTEQGQSNLGNATPKVDHHGAVHSENANSMEKMRAAQAMKKPVWGPEVTQEVETLASAGAILDVGCGSAYDPMLDSAYTGPKNEVGNMGMVKHAYSK